MKRLVLWMVMVGVVACSGKDDTASPAAGASVTDSGTVDSGSTCTGTEGDLQVTVLVDGYTPGNTENFRALVKRADEEPIEFSLDEAAVGLISIEEGAYSVSARALDEKAYVDWVDFVAVIACARTELTLDMLGIGR